MVECQPEISIVVPVYNVDATMLMACIESALAQTFTNFELILVDDASTDGSADVCARFTDPRVRLLRLPQNGGVSHARNYGVENSRGEYICFLDSDDRMHPTLLKRLYTIAKSCNSDIAAAGYRIVSPLSPIPTTVAERPISIASPIKAIEKTLYQTALDNSPCSKLYRRKVCLEAPFLPGRYEDLRTFYHIFLRADKVVWTTEPLYFYSDNPASYIHTFNTGRAVVLDVTEEIVAFMEAYHPELAPAAHDRALSAAFNIFNLLTANRVKAPEIEKRCKATIYRYRRESLFNPRVRLKNKFGILLSYLGGFPALRLAAFFLQKP